MRRPQPVADELRDLLLDCIEYRVLPPGSSEAALAAAVVKKGLRGLTKHELQEWEEKVLPVVSLPIHDIVDRARF